MRSKEIEEITEEEPVVTKGKASSGNEVLAGKYRILLANPLPELDTPSASAYAAENIENPSEPLFALVPEVVFPFRRKTAEALLKASLPSALPLRHYEPVFLPDRNVSRMVLIYARPLGGKVMPEGKVTRPFGETEIMGKVIEPFVSFLRELDAMSITCRGIRPDNLFYLDEAKTKIVVGDFLAANPASEQPMFAEDIESSLCHLQGRGEGRNAEDIYSLAVTTLALAVGSVPEFWLKDEELLAMKIEVGSYTTMAKRFEDFTFMLDFLKGCLADYSEQRWTVDVLGLWLSGKKVPFLGSSRGRCASRGYLFNGNTYFLPRSLAIAFVKNWKLATEDIYSESFSAWLSRAFGDDVKLSEEFAALKKESMTRVNNPAQKDILLAETCMLLDDKAPVRYRTLSFMPDGLGALLVNAYQTGEELTPFYEVIANVIPGSWKGIMPENVGYSPALFSSLAAEIKSNNWGSGLERCLYMLARTCPCLSRLLEKHYVENIEALLPSLNEAASTEDTKQKPIDRHIAAFIACRFAGVSPQPFETMSKNQEYMFLEAMILLYALVQKHYGPQTLNGLSSWIGGLLVPIVESYYNQNIRKRIEADIPKIIRKGSIIELSAYLNDVQIRKEDKEGFTSATKEYIYTVKEMEELEQKRPEMKKYSAALGEQLAAIIAVSTVLIVAFSLLISFLF
ncbi:MAG: hypothetical protein IKD08_05135 [Alphaproteobacteria bacterium]|nr:hypothetical protein [Alphaproteobacteria bacterium]